jgi:hypothetical protein
VEDYLFAAAIPPGPSLESPTKLTHVTYRWHQPTTTMELYLDGHLAGTNKAATTFQMPTGAGFLGDDGSLEYGMLGVIERATVYNDAIPAADIRAHADAWLSSDLDHLFEITDISVVHNSIADEATVALT